MKTKIIQNFIWLLALSMGLMVSCKDNDSRPDDPYDPPSDKSLFLPVLVHAVDMEKLKEAEEARGGRLIQKTPADPSRGRVHHVYVFEYTDKDVKATRYEIYYKDKRLSRAIQKVTTDAAQEDLKALLKEKDFSEDHVLVRMFSSGLAREKDGLFHVDAKKKGEEWEFKYEQYETQPKPMPTINALDRQWYKSFKKQRTSILKSN